MFWDGFSKELQNGLGKLFLCGIGAIEGDVLVHHGPESFNWIKVRAIGRQLDQVDAAVFALEKSPDIRPFAVSGVIPDHVDNAFILIAVLNLGQQLHGTDAIHCNRRDERRSKDLTVQRALNVDAGAACRGFENTVHIYTRACLFLNRNEYERQITPDLVIIDEAFLS